MLPPEPIDALQRYEKILKTNDRCHRPFSNLGNLCTSPDSRSARQTGLARRKAEPQSAECAPATPMRSPQRLPWPVLPPRLVPPERSQATTHPTRRRISCARSARLRANFTSSSTARITRLVAPSFSRSSVISEFSASTACGAPEVDVSLVSECHESARQKEDQPKSGAERNRQVANA